MSDGIYKWPGGYAARVPADRWVAATDAARNCCSGHRTPEEAAEHGTEVYRERTRKSAAEWRNHDQEDA